MLGATGSAPARSRARPSPAAAGIHRGNQLKPGGIPDMPVGPRHNGFTGLERLAQTVQYICREFRQFIQKQDRRGSSTNLFSNNAQQNI